MKKDYETPVAEKLEFDYVSTVSASGGLKNPAQCAGTNPGHGCGKPEHNGNAPGNCTAEHDRFQPFQCVN